MERVKPAQQLRSVPVQPVELLAARLPRLPESALGQDLPRKSFISRKQNRVAAAAREQGERNKNTFSGGGGDKGRREGYEPVLLVRAHVYRKGPAKLRHERVAVDLRLVGLQQGVQIVREMS